MATNMTKYNPRNRFQRHGYWKAKLRDPATNAADKAYYRRILRKEGGLPPAIKRTRRAT